jgi:signal transduction histidine kinase
MLFLIALLWSTVRRVDRGREAAQRSAAESAILVDAADALASSLEPMELLARLRNELSGALRLDRLTIKATQSRGPEAASHPLSDGSWLVAERRGLPFTSHEDRLLHSVTSSLDTALANAILYATVRDSADERRELLERLDTAHEDERRTIVGELHDLLAGDLIRLLYGVRGIIARPAAVPDAIQQELIALELRIAATEDRLRAFMSRIRPVEADDVGLVFALEHAVGRIRQEAGLEVRLRVMGPTDELPSGVKRTLLRTTEEALLNVIKHAGARSVLVRLHVGSAVVLSIDDDGVGWTGQAPGSTGRGLGLAYARERVTSLGGSLRTEDSRLGGARVVVQMPREGTA